MTMVSHYYSHRYPQYYLHIAIVNIIFTSLSSILTSQRYRQYYLHERTEFVIHRLLQVILLLVSNNCHTPTTSNNEIYTTQHFSFVIRREMRRNMEMFTFYKDREIWVLVKPVLQEGWNQRKYCSISIGLLLSGEGTIDVQRYEIYKQRCLINWPTTLLISMTGCLT